MTTRLFPWRKDCPDDVKKVIVKALASEMYVVQELGPLAFIVKEGEGRDKKYRVALGQLHQCTCPLAAFRTELCPHIVWIMLKVMKVPESSEILYQKALIDREISDLIANRARTQKPIMTKKSVVISEAGGVTPREIEDGDVCPICQDDLKSNDSIVMPLLYCKGGCGNHVHLKCMKLVADHHAKCGGGDQVRCPYCREFFGSMKDIQKFYMKDFKIINNSERIQTHIGTECKVCHIAPIFGTLYRCRSCKSGYSICENCFLRGDHAGHFVEAKKTRKSGWRLVVMQNGSLLPEALINDLQNRDLNDADYEMLKNLKVGSQFMFLPPISEKVTKAEPIIQSPAILYREIFNPDHVGIDETICKCCLKGFLAYESVRKLTCGHIYHTNCIDEWVSSNHSSCPIDGISIPMLKAERKFKENSKPITPSFPKVSSHPLITTGTISENNLDSLLLTTSLSTSTLTLPLPSSSLSSRSQSIAKKVIQEGRNPNRAPASSSSSSSKRRNKSLNFNFSVEGVKLSSFISSDPMETRDPNIDA